MNRVSKNLTALILSAGAVALSGQLSGGALPSGTFDEPVSSASNPLWDVSRVSVLNSLHIGVSQASTDVDCQVAFSMNGAGKLSGSGTTDVQVDSPQFSGTVDNATYKVTGSVSAQGGVAKLTYNATLMGTVLVANKRHAVTASGTYSTTFNAPAQSLTGTYIDKVSAAGIGSGRKRA